MQRGSALSWLARAPGILGSLAVLCQVMVVSRAMELPVFVGPVSKTDVATVPWFSGKPGPLNVTTLHGMYATTGRPYTAYVAVLEDMMRFQFGITSDGCTNHKNVQETAHLLQCQWATNGGFFAFTPPACIGNIIAAGQDIQLPATGNVNFGLTNNSFVIGFISEDDIKNHRFGFFNLLSGSGWLVRDGNVYVNKSSDIDPGSSFVTEKAPRTAVAVDAHGRLMSVVVDGIESTKEGPDLFEFAWLLTHLGAVQAVNLDGGGSTTAIYNDKVYNRPTCKDTPQPICMRDVTTITCIHP